MAPELLALAASVRRAGGGPRQRVRIDPGLRGYTQRQASPPEDFGFDGPKAATPFGEPGADPTGADITASFQRSGAAAALMDPGGGDYDIAARAQAFLRTAGRKFTPREQRELEAEFHPLGARNLPTEEELQGTHYIG
jgi:hypothetical protein